MFEPIMVFFLSLIANTFSAFFGGGAGLIQLPVLIFLGLPFSVALATHKIASVALGLGATLRHLKNSQLERSFACFNLLWGLPGVVIGAYWVVDLPQRSAEIALGVLTLSLGVYSVFSPRLGQHFAPKNRSGWPYYVGGLGLFLIGLVNGALSSGTGLLVTLWQIRWFGLDYQRAVAYTLVLVGLFWNGSGALTLSLIGPVQWHWLPILIIASLLGGYLGAHLSIIKGNAWIKRGFEGVTLLIGLKLILG